MMLSAVIIAITISVLIAIWFWWWAIKEMEFNDSFWAKKPEKKQQEQETPLSTIGQAAFLSVTSFPETWKYYCEGDRFGTRNVYCGWKNEDFKLRQRRLYPYDERTINGYSVTEEEYNKIINVLLDRDKMIANQKREKASQELLDRVLKKAQAKLEQIRKEQTG